MYATPSLRAEGEAIHNTVLEGLDCFVATLLAMTEPDTSSEVRALAHG